MYANAEQTLKVRTNKRVRQALARRDIFVEEFDFLTGELSATEQGYALYLPKCGLNVFLRKATSGRCSLCNRHWQCLTHFTLVPEFSTGP